ncbi:hypothetical protein MMAN_16380 [Mycobacterium mantenii]|uniref:HTH cro/C1-type domain-containing protein n=1 Tax=Mycobacterium mantenii TaxID=560555 RepID=A0A1X0FDD3_MYCNT|nr:helix-turn-helix transcriptional regulator [Mycobacterium mantenii]MCV7245877.1 helix-turn-helix transcriptional regulator [Mycobacterium mantenii]ORA99821.1 hypothetical protein BST30_23625 [Mycobacterium mantenii]BBY37504.1 hypothetical protein MMAN_16380 [Mycobacterium mantenii]
MAGKEPDIGATSRTVAANVKRLREAMNMNFTQLSERLIATAGWSINAVGIRRLEAEERRVTPDDLVALAVALGVSPITLLMPVSHSGDDAVEATGVKSGVAAHQLWRWYQAAGQLHDGEYDEFLTFVARALPPWRQRQVELVESGIEPHVTRFVRERVGDGDD